MLAILLGVCKLHDIKKVPNRLALSRISPYCPINRSKLEFPQKSSSQLLKIMAEDSPELMTVKETAEYLRIPLPTVYYLVQRGQLPAVQIGGRWRIKRSLLDRDVLKTEGAGQPTVLVVDDDAALQTIFKQFLKKAGFGRIVVGSGTEAISYAEKQKFDLVFLDLQLPDMSGDEVYLRLKEIHPDLPIVIITGYPDSEILSKILQIGPVTVIKKPIEFEQLNRTVKQLGHKGMEMVG
jgi:excisionase family DNA binding protein